MSRTRFDNRVESEWSIGQEAKNAKDTWLSLLSLLRIIIIQERDVIFGDRDLVRQVKVMFLTSCLKRGRSISCDGEVGERGIEQRGDPNARHQPRQNQ